MTVGVSVSPDDRKQYQKFKQEPLAHPGLFAQLCFNHEYDIPEHLARIYHAVFEALHDGVPDAPKYLCYLMPREHGKSQAATVVVPTWLALINPDSRILIMSQTEGQAKGKLREIRDQIERLGPRFGRSITENNKTELTLTRNESHDVPTIKAAGFNTGITGGHFDVILFDDIISWENQRTGARREKVWQQFQDYLNLGTEGDTVYTVVGTRKHPDDLYQNLIDGPAWATTVRQAISDWSIVENGEYSVRTDAGNTYSASEIPSINGSQETIVSVEPHRQVDVLWPERWPLDQLLMDMIAGYGSEQGTLIWRRENQNDAEALQGQVLSEEMVTFTDTRPPRRDLVWYAGLDPAVEDDPQKAAENDTDYWALSIVGYDPESDVTYVDDIRRKRGLTISQGLSWVESALRPYPISTCLVEDAQAQRWFVQTGQDKGLDLKRSSSNGKKEDRILSMSSRLESGRVQIYAEESSAKWESFLGEWVGFPNSRHDDRLDALEISLRNIGDRRSRNSGSSTWYDPF